VPQTGEKGEQSSAGGPTKLGGKRGQKKGKLRGRKPRRGRSNSFKKEPGLGRKGLGSGGRGLKRGKAPLGPILPGGGGSKKGKKVPY